MRQIQEDAGWELSRCSELLGRSNGDRDIRRSNRNGNEPSKSTQALEGDGLRAVVRAI